MVGPELYVTEFGYRNHDNEDEIDNYGEEVKPAKTARNPSQRAVNYGACLIGKNIAQRENSTIPTTEP